MNNKNHPNIIALSSYAGSGKDTVAKIIQYLTSNYNDGFHSFDQYLLDVEKRNDYPIFLKWQNKKFSNKLKDIVCLLIGCTREQLEDQKFKETELGKEWDKYKYYINIGGSHYYGYCNTEEDCENLYLEKIKDIKHNNHRWYADLVKMTPRLLMQLIGTDCMRDIVHQNLWVNSLMNDYKSAGEKCGFTSYSAIDIKEGFQKKPNWIISDLRFPNELKAIKDRGGVCIRINRPGLIKSNHLSETSLDSATFDYIIDNNSDINSLIEKVREILVKENII